MGLGGRHWEWLVLVALLHGLAGEEEIARYESEFSNGSMAARVLPGLNLHNLGSSDKQGESPNTLVAPTYLTLTLALPATVSPLCYTGSFKPGPWNLCSPVHPHSTGFPLPFWAPLSPPQQCLWTQHSSHLPPECSSSLPLAYAVPLGSLLPESHVCPQCGALVLVSLFKVPSSWF